MSNTVANKLFEGVAMPETEDAFEYLYHTISSSESSKTSVFWFQIASFDLVFDAMSYLEINNGMNSTS